MDVVLNKAGIARFLRDQRKNPKMIAALTTVGESLAAKAGPGFKTSVSTQRGTRPRVVVIPATAQARRGQLKDNRLGRALGSS